MLHRLKHSRCIKTPSLLVFKFPSFFFPRYPSRGKKYTLPICPTHRRPRLVVRSLRVRVLVSLFLASEKCFLVSVVFEAQLVGTRNANTKMVSDVAEYTVASGGLRRHSVSSAEMTQDHAVGPRIWVYLCGMLTQLCSLKLRDPRRMVHTPSNIM